MNLKQLSRAAVCAAIVALVIVGAGFFPSQLVSGQETPLTIDPSFVLQQKLAASDGRSHDYFGNTVALSGDTMVVGAYSDDIGANLNQGSAYVFKRSSGVWTLQQKLTASDGTSNNFFGSAVAISGDTVVVGAPETVAGGAAYVFTRNGATWTQQQKLNGAAPNGYFGASVAISGDTVAVGAPGTGTTAVFIFTRSGTLWTQRQRLSVAGNIFGSPVAISGNTLVVGSGGIGSGGSAYIFTRNGTVWTQQQRLTAPVGPSSNGFASSVAINGETVVVGAPLESFGANEWQGSAYVFTRSGAVWSLQQKLIASDGAWLDNFGGSVTISGNTLVVGAVGNDVGGNTDQGSTYIFTRDGNLWSQQKLTAADGVAGDGFGTSVVINGDTLVVGTPYINIGANIDQGSVYVFKPACPTFTIEPSSLTKGITGIPYSQTLTAIGGTAPYRFLPVGALPPGFSLSTDGVLSGTPTLDGSFEFRIRILDANDCETRWATSIVILKWENGPCPTFTIEPSVLPDGMTFQSYAQTLTASGGNAPYRFVAQSPLPPGLSLSIGGVLSGTPTLDGNFEFRVRVLDANNCETRWATSITIEKSHE